jgi:hypothetical protein
MISAHLTSNEAKGGRGTMLALTHAEAVQLRAILDRVIEEVQTEKNAYLVTRPGDRDRGRLIRNGIDITLVTFETERLAREFRRRL